MKESTRQITMIIMQILLSVTLGAGLVLYYYNFTGKRTKQNIGQELSDIAHQVATRIDVEEFHIIFKTPRQNEPALSINEYMTGLKLIPDSGLPVLLKELLNDTIDAHTTLSSKQNRLFMQVLARDRLTERGFRIAAKSEGDFRPAEPYKISGSVNRRLKDISRAASSHRFLIYVEQGVSYIGGFWPLKDLQGKSHGFVEARIPLSEQGALRGNLNWLFIGGMILLILLVILPGFGLLLSVAKNENTADNLRKERDRLLTDLRRLESLPAAPPQSPETEKSGESLRDFFGAEKLSYKIKTDRSLIGAITERLTLNLEKYLTPAQVQDCARLLEEVFLLVMETGNLGITPAEKKRALDEQRFDELFEEKRRAALDPDLDVDVVLNKNMLAVRLSARGEIVIDEELKRRMDALFDDINLLEEGRKLVLIKQIVKL